MKRKHLFISILLISSILITGCGKIEGKVEKNPEAAQNTTQAGEDVLPTESVAATPTPTEATFSMKQGYGDANREISILGLKEYKKLKGEKYTDKAQDGMKYLVLFLKLRNRSVNKDYFHVDYLSAKVDGKDIENTFLLNEPEGYPTIFTNIAANTTQSGFIVWEIPSDWKKLEVTYNGWQGSDGLSLHTTLTKADLKKPDKYSGNN